MLEHPQNECRNEGVPVGRILEPLHLENAREGSLSNLFLRFYMAANCFSIGLTLVAFVISILSAM